MIKVLIPTDKRQGKTKVRGLWVNDNGKLFYYYLGIKEFYSEPSYKCLENLKRQYNQEAIFYVNYNKGFCYTDRIEMLPHRIYKEVLRYNLKRELKEALKIYRGITIYQNEGKYFIEIFYK
jgi:hypothetical protein